MAENVKIDLEENSKYRVAMELAQTIKYAEHNISGQNPKPMQAEKAREYWLTLYQQCLSVTAHNWTAEDALKSFKSSE